MRCVWAIGLAMLVACDLPKNGLGPQGDDGGPGLDACCADGPPADDASDAAVADSTGDVAAQDAPGPETTPGADSGDAGDAPTTLAGHALQFSGGAYLQMGPVPIPQDFTLEAWVFPVGTPGGEQCVIADERTGQLPYQFRLGIAASGMLFFMMTDGNGDTGGLFTGTGSYALVAPQAMKASVWTHVAVTKAGTLFTLYANGAQVAQFTATAPLDHGNPLLAFRVGARVGLDGDSPDCTFTGTVDEVRLWSVPRSASQIAANMSHTVSAGDPTLFAYWRFDEGTGKNALDEEGHYTGGFGVWTTSPLWVPSSAF